MQFAAMGLRFLNKRRLRTIMTIMAVVLGVGILTGINVTADSIDTGINAQITAQLGYTDIIVRANGSVSGGWIPYTTGREFITGIPDVATLVPRIIKERPSYPVVNSTVGWNTYVIAINTTDPAEPSFGVSNLTKSWDPTLENTTHLEKLFQEYNSHIFLPVVVSQGYANAFNLHPGDPLYMFPENPAANSSSMVATNTSTWLNATIIGVLQDTSKAVDDFTPPPQVWDLSPPSTAVYVDLGKAWSYLYNNHSGYVNMFFVHADDPTHIQAIQNAIEGQADAHVFPGGAFTVNDKSMFTEGILQINFLMRGIFSIFAGISLLVCAIIIKNLLEVSKEEQMREIGIMRAIGVTKGKVLEMYLSQISFIGLVGSGLGLVLGYFLSGFFVGSYEGVGQAVGTDFSHIQIAPVMSGLTVAIGMLAGFFTCFLFGLIPARSAANVDPLEALHAYSEKKKISLLAKTIRTTGSLSVAVGLTVGGVIIVGSAFGGLFLLDIINPQVIALLFAGVIMLVMGIVLVGAFFFPVLVPATSTIVYPFIGRLQKLTVRNLGRYSRQTKNTYAMLAIGLCMMITVGTIMNSAYAGAYPGGRTITGGDLSIGNFARGHVPMNPTTAGLRSLPDVAQAVPIRFSLGFEGYTRIDRNQTNATFGGIQDSALGPVQESFHLAILDTVEYANLNNHDSIVKISTADMTLNMMMARLEAPYTIALQDRVARQLGGVAVGEWVRLRFDGFEANFLVVGIYQILPGFYWTYYTADSAFDKQFTGAISWDAYTQMINDNVGKTDVIARNKVVPPASDQNLLPSGQAWGYVNSPLDYQTLDSLAAQTGLVQNSTYRQTSVFWSLPPFQWENTTSADPNILWHENNSVSPDWNTMDSRALVIDPSQDQGFGNTTIASYLPSIPASRAGTLEDILLWAKDAMPDENVCIVNQIYVDMNLTTGTYDYIKKFVPGDTIRMYYNDTVYSNFLVIATTNSHYPYAYTDNQSLHHGDTGVLNFKALSYNTYTYNTTDWDYYYEALDAEPNSIFIPRTSAQLPPNLFTDLVQSNLGGEPGNYSAIPWWLNYTLQDLYMFNSTFLQGIVPADGWVGNYTVNGTSFQFDGSQVTYQGVAQNVTFSTMLTNGSQVLNDIMSDQANMTIDNLTTEVMFQLKDGMTPADIDTWIATMTAICQEVPTLRNVTFFAPRQFLFEQSHLFDVYFLIGATSKDKIDQALLEIENYYLAHHLPWDTSWILKATDTEQRVGGILGLITNMFFGVLSFALVTSLLGLSISMVISVRKRYTEIGTLRTLGFSNRQILGMITSEGVITAILGIIAGLIIGLLIAYLIISNLPFMIFLPILFTPPVDLITEGLVVLLAAAVGASFLPAAGATRIDIADAIRAKGE